MKNDGKSLDRHSSSLAFGLTCVQKSHRVEAAFQRLHHNPRVKICVNTVESWNS